MAGWLKIVENSELNSASLQANISVKPCLLTSSQIRTMKVVYEGE